MAADLPDALADHATVHRAEGVLATMLDVPITEARAALELRAQMAGSSLADAAQLVLDDHARRVDATAPRPADDLVLAVLRRHLRN